MFEVTSARRLDSLTASRCVYAEHVATRGNDDIHVVSLDHLVKACRNFFGMGKRLLTSLGLVFEAESLLQQHLIWVVCANLSSKQESRLSFGQHTLC